MGYLIHLLLQQEANWQVNFINLKSKILSLHSKKPSEYADFIVCYTDSADLLVSSPALALLLFCFPGVLLFYPVHCELWMFQLKQWDFLPLLFLSFYLTFLNLSHSQGESFAHHQFAQEEWVFTVWWEPSTSIVWNEMVSLPNHRLVYMSWISQWN